MRTKKVEEKPIIPTLPNIRQCIEYAKGNPLTVEEIRRIEGDEKVIKVFEGLHNPETLGEAFSRAIIENRLPQSEELASLNDEIARTVIMVVKFYKELQKWGAAYYQIMLEKYGGKV